MPFVTLIFLLGFSAEFNFHSRYAATVDTCWMVVGLNQSASRVVVVVLLLLLKDKKDR